LIPGDPKKMKVGFVANAADVYEDNWFIEDDRKKLKELGFAVINFDLRNKKQGEVETFLKFIDIVLFGGGAANYLLKVSQECGLDKIIEKHVLQGLIYVGSSAGTVVAGTTTKPYYEEEKNDPEMKGEIKPASFEAFKIVDFIPLPHYNQDVYRKYNDQIIKEYSSKYKFETLNDNEVIIIIGDVTKKQVFDTK